MSGTICLDKALVSEWELGFDGMPASLRAMLPPNVESVLNMSVHERKSWLVLLRGMREKQGDLRLQDEFSIAGSSLQKWVGL